MKKYFILLACLSVIACKNVEQECCPENPLVDSVAVPPADAPAIVEQDSTIAKITQSLQKSENVEQEIQCIIEDKAILQVQNNKLNKELKVTKDSLQKVTYELRETKLKLPKKRSFFQRVLGVAKDSVEVIKTDTIQTN